MSTDHSIIYATAAGSTGGTILAFIIKLLPLLQASAALVAIISGSLSIYIAFKNRKR